MKWGTFQLFLGSQSALNSVVYHHKTILTQLLYRLRCTSQNRQKEAVLNSIVSTGPVLPSTTPSLLFNPISADIEKIIKATITLYRKFNTNVATAKSPTTRAIAVPACDPFTSTSSHFQYRPNNHCNPTHVNGTKQSTALQDTDADRPETDLATPCALTFPPL